MHDELRQEVRFLTTRLGDIVREQAGRGTFGHVEALRSLTKAIRQHGRKADLAKLQAHVKRLSVAQSYEVAHAFSLFFQVVNLCEERERVRRLTAAKNQPQSLRWLFQFLRDYNVSAAKLAECLETLEIQPVLTAHPTEAKRRSTLNQILRLAENPSQPDEVLEALWQTEETREERIRPMDEVKHVLFFFEHTIFDTVASFYETFDAELKKAYPSLERKRPFLTFASWVGGDRDGHPFITPDISREAAKRNHEQIGRAHV